MALTTVPSIGLGTHRHTVKVRRLYLSSPPGCACSYFSILCKMRHPAVCVMGNFALTLAVYVLGAFPARLC